MVTFDVETGTLPVRTDSCEYQRDVLIGVVFVKNGGWISGAEHALPGAGGFHIYRVHDGRRDVTAPAIPSTALGPFPTGLRSVDAGLRRSRYVRRRPHIE